MRVIAWLLVVILTGALLVVEVFTTVPSWAVVSCASTVWAAGMIGLGDEIGAWRELRWRLPDEAKMAVTPVVAKQREPAKGTDPLESLDWGWPE